MTELEKMLRLFSEVGLRYTFSTIAGRDIFWFDLPPKWHKFATVESAGAIYLFDNDGNFAGVCWGDERNTYEVRL